MVATRTYEMEKLTMPVDLYKIVFITDCECILE